MPVVGKRGPPCTPPALPIPPIRSCAPPAAPTPRALGEGVALGWEVEDWWAPPSLCCAPTLYIAPRCAPPHPYSPPPPPCLFKRYFHSCRVLYSGLKPIIYTVVCWTGGKGSDTWRGAQGITYASCLPPSVRLHRIGGGEGGKGGGDGDIGCQRDPKCTLHSQDLPVPQPHGCVPKLTTRPSVQVALGDKGTLGHPPAGGTQATSRAQSTSKTIVVSLLTL